MYETQSFVSQVKLVLNYADEYSQMTREKGIISNFYPEPRATNVQLKKIGSLICDQLSHQRILKEDGAYYDLNFSMKMKGQSLPVLIRHDIHQIIGHKSSPPYSYYRHNLLQR
ncbi:hypothetical protein H4Q26_009321 [Puccinia striiformis f. sp. tritici PST-130]|nr:hypothetical protein H4Q26_009321 [Puccinia striiformis f. sp. tritici PST-130]